MCYVRTVPLIAAQVVSLSVVYPLSKHILGYLHPFEPSLPSTTKPTCRNEMCLTATFCRIATISY
jgi:hypothetical protein